MTLRPPSTLATRHLLTGADDLEAEIMAEKAAALGRAGRAVEKALATLAACGPEAAERPALALAAARAVHGLFIQRELMGFRNHAETVGLYAIPREVLAKVGVAG